MNQYMKAVLSIAVLGVAVICVADAVAAPQDDDQAGPTYLSDGVAPAQAEPSEDGLSAEESDLAALARDCVYVQWCNEPGPNGTICRLRSGCTDNEETRRECIADTRAVCGAPVLPWYIF